MAAKKKYSASAIGDAGEAIFDRWCRQVGYNSMRPQPDMVGIDRLVQIPQSAGIDRPRSLLTIGSRAANHALVQIKTTRSKLAGTTRLKLSIAQTLAEADLPSFIVYIRIDSHEKPVAARVCHIDPELGEKILSQVARVQSDLHREEFVLRWSSAHDISANADGIKVRFDDAIGDAESYAERRARWRRTVGFDSKPISITVSAPVDAMARYFLGIQTESDHVAVTRGEQRRFGQVRPIENLEGARIIGITPRSSGGCPLRIRSVRSGEWIDLEGTFFTTLGVLKPDQVPSDLPIWRWSSTGITLLGKQDATVAITVSLEDNKPAPMRSWQCLYRALNILTDGPTELSIGLVGPPTSSFPTLGTLDASGRSAEWDDICSILSTATKFAAVAHISSTHEFSGPELVDGWIERSEWLEDASGKDVTVRFELDELAAGKLPEESASMLILYRLCRMGQCEAVSIIETEPRSLSSIRRGGGRFEIISKSSSTHHHPIRSPNFREEARAIVNSTPRAGVVVFEFFDSVSSRREDCESKDDDNK